jgi:hypothetical protein
MPWASLAFSGGGGPLPTNPPYDIFCVGPCQEIAVVLSYLDVSTIGSDSQFPIDPMTMDQLIASGGPLYPTTDAAVFFNVSVPETFTLEVTALWKNLPQDFSDLTNKHSYIGAFDPSGGCVGLFFSQIGILYSGSVSFDPSNNLILETPVQPLPGSQEFVSQNTYWTILVAMSFGTGAVYIYITETSQVPVTGHQLRYVMPVIPSSSAAIVPPSEVVVSSRGTLTQPTVLSLDSICLGTGVILPSLQPVANPGPDQAIQMCSILQLDGTASSDPQNAPLTYKWRLINAPPGSQYVFDGADGLTYPLMVPTGFTNHFYSESLETLNETQPLQVGDVLVVQGNVYDVAGTGTDVHGFYVAISDFTLPDSYSTNTTFKYLFQNGLNTSTSPKPTFYPDVAGIWLFDLTVFDGVLYSLPVVVLINVLVSSVARGCVPDLTFVWNYLSDFWNLVQGTERITTFWQGLAQVAAAELLSLWQIDYSKSLRDIQRTFQRKWLHYDLLMTEAQGLIESTTVRAVYGGVESSDILNAGVSGVSGTHLDIQFAEAAAPTVVNLSQPNPYTPVQLQAIFQAAFAQLDARIVVHLLPQRAGTISHLRIDAPFPFVVLPTSTFPFYTPGQLNGIPSGVAGAGVVTPNTYRAEKSLQYLDIELNDFLCIDGVAYRITGVVDNASDPWYFQRLILADPLPVPAGTTWDISGTVVSPDLNFWSGMVEQGDIVTYEVLNTQTNALTQVTGLVLGSSQALTANLPVDATVVGLYLAQPATYSVFLGNVLRRKYMPLDPLIVDVPLLQALIVSPDDTQVLRRNVDYFFDTFRGSPCLRFITPVPANAGGPDVWQGQPPPGQLWAEYSYLDNSTRIQNNFGIPAEFTLADLAQLPSSVDYLSAVQGLWYSYFNGPTVYNLRVGTQILLGLPFAEVTGTIIGIRNDFTVNSGQILVQDLDNPAIVRDYTYPAALALETNPATNEPYAIGDVVQQFAPLVTGVEIADYVNTPDWFQGYLEQGAFFEVDKFFTFLVRVDSTAFNLQALLFAKSFVLRIKPTYTYPLFVVLLTIDQDQTTVTVSDEVTASGVLSIFDGACFDSTMGAATMFDQPRPAGGGWRNQFDHNADPNTPATYPTPNYPIIWAYDKNYLCPEDFIMGIICTVYAVPGPVVFDSVFSFDEPAYTGDLIFFSAGLTSLIPVAGNGLPIGGSGNITVTGTLTNLSLEVIVHSPTLPNTFNLIIQQNGTTVLTEPFTASGNVALTFGISVPVTSGDVITAYIQPTGVSDVAVAWDSVLVEAGIAIPWQFDVDLPAGTYCGFRVL